VFRRAVVLPACALVLGALLARSAAAQQVWVVDDSLATGPDATTVQGAVTAASAGDIILVRDGDYPAFVIDGKALTVVADSGASVHVQGVRVRNLAAGQSVAIVGLTASVTQAFLPGVEVLGITQRDGPVLIQSCAFGGLVDFALLPLKPTAVVTDSAAVTFAQSALFGREIFSPLDPFTSGVTAAALQVAGSQVQLAQSTALGATGDSSYSDGVSFYPATAGGTAVQVAGSYLVLLGSKVSGGTGGNGSFSPLWQSCSSGAPGGAALQLDAGSTADARASIVVGGQGGHGGQNPDLGGFCADGATGAAAEGDGVLNVTPGTAAQLEVAPAVLREGGNGTLSLLGGPGDGALLLVGFGQLQAWWPAHGGVLLPAAPLVLPLGPLSAGGTLGLLFVAPDLPASMDGLVVVLQSAATSGGPVLLGGGGVLVILDAAF
jgi:hypothetical protein